MLRILLCGLFFTITGILYCCVRNTTTYDKEINDLEQEKFLKEWKKGV